MIECMLSYLQILQVQVVTGNMAASKGHTGYPMSGKVIPVLKIKE